MSFSKADQTDQKPGFWSSNFSAEDAVKGLKEYGQLAVSGDDCLYWVEYQPEQGGRNALCCCHPENEQVRCLTPDDFSVRSQVHEYGGLSWCLLDTRVVFVNAQDQQLWLQSTCGGTPNQLTQTPESRYGAPVWDSKRNRLIAVQEVHPDGVSPDQVVNRLVAVDLENGDVSVLHQGDDFYDQPILSKNRDQLAWISWNHPEQPWTQTHLNQAQISKDGTLSDLSVVVSGEQALTQPRFSEDDTLHVVSDKENWWQIYRCETDGLAVFGGQESADYAAASWQLGQSSYVLLEEGWIASIHQSGVGYLKLWRDNTLVHLAADHNHFRSLTLKDDKLYCVASSDTHLAAILKIDLNDYSELVITGGESVLVHGELSKPNHIAFPVADEFAYAFFYPPANEAFSSAESLPPLVIFLHGGPTSAAYPTFNPKTQYWTQRGFAVADLNYRGSTGYGRDYRMELKRQWGIADVEDAVALVDHLSQQQLINPSQVFIRGGSAGGFTALAALAASNCFAGGASLYGVSDLNALCVSTHKFESRYLDWLIGNHETDRLLYRQRSPINNVKGIHCPVIFFQGMLDKVVPPKQTELMVDALRENGVSVEVHRYPDEYHGFRDPGVQQQVLDLELAFYCRLISSNYGAG